MSKLKNFIRNNLLGAIIGGLVFGASGVIADTIVKSNDVSYKETDVKAAVDDLYRVAGIHVEDIESELMLKIYPVGSIYTSISSTSPATLFGGTWERFGKGKTLVSVDEDNTNFQTVEKTGGSETKTISVENLPAHTHGVNINTNSTNHNHGTINTTSTNHSHGTINTSNHGGHTHTAGSHIVQSWAANTNNGGSPYGQVAGNTGGSITTNTGGAHTHTVTINNSGAHTHQVTINNSGGHTHNVNGNTGSTGSGTALNVQNPYITVYMWKRTA